MPADDQLKGAARSFAAGKIDAVFNVDAVLMRAECPHFLVRRHQHDAVAVGQAGCFNRGMQVKANREFIARAAHARLAFGVQENILAFSRVPSAESIKTRSWTMPKRLA